MQYLIIPLILFVVLACVNKEVLKAEKNMDENNFVVRQSKIVMWIGIICILFFGGIIILMSIYPNDTADWWIYLIFFSFLLLGLYITVYCVFWELKINGNDLSYTSVFKRPKKFTFNNIAKVKIKIMPNNQMQEIKVYSSTKKLFTVESNCRGYNILVSRLKKEHIPFE